MKINTITRIGSFGASPWYMVHFGAQLRDTFCTIDDLRRMFGHFSVQRALMFTDKPLTDLKLKDDHVTFSVANK